MDDRHPDITNDIYSALTLHQLEEHFKRVSYRVHFQKMVICTVPTQFKFRAQSIASPLVLGNLERLNCPFQVTSEIQRPLVQCTGCNCNFHAEK